MLKRVAAIGSSTAVIGALLTGALSSPAFAACPSASAPTAVGGVYQLSTAGHIEWIRSANVGGTDAQLGYDYAMTGDIDMGVCTWTSPIAPATGVSITTPFVGTPFSGTFDGGGYTISGLTIDDRTGSPPTTSTNNMALIGYANGATVRNLVFSGSVFGDSNTGGVIGVAISTTVSDVGASGAITGYGDQVGGLIGRTYTSSSITDSWATGRVQGIGSDSDDVGGLIGQADDSEILRSWATGDVDGDDNSIGGLLGNSDNTDVSNSYATGNVRGTGSGFDNIGGLVGEVLNARIADSWSSGTVDGNENVGGLVGLGSGIEVIDSYATGAVVSSSVDVGGLGGDMDGTITRSWASGQVGTAASRNDYSGGLIGEARSSTITDSWASGNVYGNEFLGGLIGGGAAIQVSGSYATGAVDGTQDNVGGLVGEPTSSSALISTSWATGSVYTTDDFAGGLVGEANGSTIEKSWASGSVRADGSGDGIAGGLVGSTEGRVSQSFATGAVSSDMDYVGGLVGEADGATISNSYATGSATGAGTVGGLVGYNVSSAVVEYSYSTGSVTGTSNVGGFVGSNSSSTVTASYWDTESSGLSSSDGGTGKTTSEMRLVTTYEGWSISEGYNPASTWGICGPVNSGYPYLTAFNSSDPCVAPPPSYQFTFRLPDGTECGAIGPVGVIDGTIYILPGEDADCRTMEGALVGGWTIPVPEGYDSIGSPAMPFAPGQKVRVSDSQQFTVVPFEPLLSLTLDSNVMADEACEANEVEFVDEANREEYSWVPRGDISMARLPMVAACQPPGYTLAGWNTASDGSGTMFEPGAGLPNEWATDKTNRYRLFAIWSPT